MSRSRPASRPPRTPPRQPPPPSRRRTPPRPPPARHDPPRGRRRHTRPRRGDKEGARGPAEDVAARAGGSVTAASRVVSDGPRRVGGPLASRVHRAVAEPGYTANLQARAVATGQSNMVGVVVHDIADPYFSSIAAGLIDIAYPRRLLVCLSSVPGEAGEQEYLALMRAQRSQAVIPGGSRSDDESAL